MDAQASEIAPVRLDARDALLPAGLLSLARVPLAVGFAIASRKPPVALALLGLAAISDILDGRVARKTHTETATGAVLDASADKAFVLAVIAALVRAHRVTLSDLAVLAARELAEAPLVLRYLREKDHVHHVPKSSAFGKLTTSLQFAALAASVLRLRVRPIVLAAGVAGVVAAAGYWRRALRDA